jgi:hypothetical protein
MTPDGDAGSLLLIRAELLTMLPQRNVRGKHDLHEGLWLFSIMLTLPPAIPFGSHQFTTLISGGVDPNFLMELH